MIDSKQKKRLLYWLVLPVILLLAFSVIIYFYINSAHFRENVKSIITTQLEDSLGNRIEIGTVDSISFQTIGLTHFRIYENASHENQNILFQAEQVKAGFKIAFLFSQWKDWKLDIQDVAFHQASAVLTRTSDGKFDLIQKLNLDPEKIQENLMIRRIHFQNSRLVYHDELVYHYQRDYLTTRARNISGYFDLSQMPKVVFHFQGVQEKDDASLALQGQFVVNQAEYSIDFQLKDADITHFQYYLEAAEQFGLRKGQFDMDFRLSSSSQSNPGDTFWQGKATFQQVDASPGFLQQIPFHEIYGSVAFTKPEITITEMNGLYNDKIARLQGTVRTEPDVYFDLNIAGEGVDSSYLKDDISLFVSDYPDFQLQGELNLNANIQGSPEDFQIGCKASASQILIDKVAFQKTDCSFLLHNDRLTIYGLNSYDDDSSLSIKGQINWPDDIPSYHLTLQTEDYSLQHPVFQKIPFLQEASGKIDSHFQIDSQTQDHSILDIEGQFTMHSFKRKDMALSELSGRNMRTVLYASKALLSIEQCELASGKNNGWIQGEMNLLDLSLSSIDFGCHLSELNELASSLGLETPLEGEADIEGTIKKNVAYPEVKAQFHLQEFSIQENLLGELTGKISYQEDTIALDEFALDHHNINVTGNGKILLRESAPPEIECSFQFPEMNIDTLTQLLTDALPLTGQASGIGQIQGVWPELTIQGEVQLEEVDYQNYPLGSGHFNFSLQPEKKTGMNHPDEKPNNFFNLLGHAYMLELKQFSLQNEGMQLTAKGETKVSSDFPFSLEIDFTHQAFADMIENFLSVNGFSKLFLPSRIAGKANLDGNISQQKVSLSALLTPQQQENNPPSQMEASFMINEQGVTISDFRLLQSEGHLTAEGFISPGGELDIDFQSEQLDINTLVNLVQIDEAMRGIMNIEGSLQGTYDQLLVSTNVQVKQGYFREFQFEDLQSDLQWNSRTNMIEIKELAIALEEGYQIQAKGNFPLSAIFNGDGEETFLEINYQEIPLDFEIRIDRADLNLLRLFWKDGFSDIQGNTNLELIFTGTAGTPIVNGAVEIHQGRVMLKNVPILMEELNARIEIAENQIVIPALPFRAYENDFTLSGQMELIRLMPQNMSLTIKNVQKEAVYQDILETEADFTTEITGSFPEPKIDGYLLLSEGELNIQQLFQFNEEKEPFLAVSTPQKSLQEITSDQLNFNIEIKDPFTLKMPNAEFEIAGKLNLFGSLKQPALQGNLILKKGYLLYFEKKFNLSDGLVTVNGFTIEDIAMNAKAITNVQNVEITINIQGNLTNPQILLSSQPVLQETEILSLLTFNRNIQGLSEGEINQLLSEEMVSILFQSLQANLFRRMERELAEGIGLDFIHLSYDNAENADTHLFFLEDVSLEDLKLEIGKSIGDDLLITYSTALDFRGESSLSMDYQLSPDLTFSTQFDTFSLKEEDYRIRFGVEIRF